MMVLRVLQAQVSLLLSGVHRGKLTSHIAQTFALDAAWSVTTQGASSFLADGFHNFPINKPLNPEPGIIRLPVRRLEVAVAASEARGVVSRQHRRHELRRSVGRSSVQRLYRCRVSFLGYRMLRRPVAGRSLLRNLEGLVLRDDTTVYFHAMVDNTIWLLQDRTYGSRG
jgi:hypothetical protein